MQNVAVTLGHPNFSRKVSMIGYSSLCKKQIFFKMSHVGYSFGTLIRGWYSVYQCSWSTCNRLKTRTKRSPKLAIKHNIYDYVGRRIM